MKQQAIDILDTLILSGKELKEKCVIPDSECYTLDDMTEMLEEAKSRIQALGDGENEYIKSLERALVFMCDSYKACSDIYRDPKNFKTEEQALESIMMFPMIQGTINHIAINNIASRKGEIEGGFSLREIYEILEKKYPSQGNSLRAKLSQPNRKAQLNQWKRINDEYTHYKIINNMQNDR